MWVIVDTQTGCRWAMGAVFTRRENARIECERLVRKYQNGDLRVVPVQ